MSLLFHIMTFIDTRGPVGLAALIDKQLSALILEGDGRQQDGGGVEGAAPKWESDFSNATASASSGAVSSSCCC